MLLSSRWISYLYLLSSLAIVPLAAAVVRNLNPEMMTAARLYLIVSMLAVLLGSIAFVFGVQSDIVFQDVSGVIRSRGLNEEPNFMGFSLVVIYILILFYDTRRPGVLIISIIWLLTFASFSAYAISSLFIVTLIYIIWRRKFKLLVWLFIPFMLAVLLNMNRIEAIIQGADNSANFRTWGSIWLAYEVLKDCSLAGCGIGSMRAVLQDNPLMEIFSAFDVLPNLAATVLLEVGPVGVIIIFGLIFSATFGSPLKQNTSLGLSFAAFYCLLSYALSGSYFYDPHFWVTLGLFAAACHSCKSCSALSPGHGVIKG